MEVMPSEELGLTIRIEIGRAMVEQRSKFKPFFFVIRRLQSDPVTGEFMKTRP